jgi:hypothetical protein
MSLQVALKGVIEGGLHEHLWRFNEHVLRLWCCKPMIGSIVQVTSLGLSNSEGLQAPDLQVVVVQ